MKLFVIAFLGLFFVASVQAQNYSIQKSPTALKFKIKNLGIWVTGKFDDYSGTINFAPDNLSNAKFSIEIKTTSINTGIDLRDDHLRKEEYFDAQNYPSISFVSTKITPSTKRGTLYLFGKLGIKGKEIEISFPFTATPQDNGFRFQGQFKINRRDLGVGGGSVTMSDEVTVMLDVYAQKL